MSDGDLLKELRDMAADAALALRTLREIAGDGCGIPRAYGVTCPISESDRGEWCWSCVAADAVKRIEGESPGGASHA